MHATILCLATVAFGVDVGWRPLPDGGMEYIIQIEPHMLDLLAKGEDIFSDIPPSVRGVRSYRITVGSDELPREGEMEPEPGASSVLTPPRDGEPDPSPLLTPPGYDEPGVPPAFVGPRYSEPAPTPGPAEAADSPPVRSEPSPSTSLPWDTPRPLRLPTDTEPLSESGEKPALFVDQEQEPAEPSGAEPEKQSEAGAEAEAQETDKPSGPFTLALAGFLGSFGGMLYTGWLAWDYRRRYRALLERMIDAGHQPEDRTGAAEAGHRPGLRLGDEDEPSGL